MKLVATTPSAALALLLACLSATATATLAAASAAPNAAPAATTAPRANVAGFTFIRSLGGIDEYRLDANGLQVLVKPDHSAPVASFQVTYHVGSRNEVTGTTGSTHLLEHLMFKGSTHFNDPAGNSVKQYLGAHGAAFNATTSYDRTNYFATLGANDLEGYVAIEADRMRNLWLHDADKQTEMTVVRNEFERGKNNPNTFLREEVQAAAFIAYPYHHSTIGWKSDIEKVSVDQLRAFYDIFYWPNNATVTFVGDIDPTVALTLTKKYYGAIPPSPHPIPEVVTEEPAQTGARRVTVSMPGEVGTVEIAYKVPGAVDADLPALDVLGDVLFSGKNSRLYRALVDTNLALNAGAGVANYRAAGLFEVTASPTPGVAHDQVEKILLAEIDKVKTDGVTPDEVTQVIHQHHAQQAYGRDGTAAVVAQLNEWISAGDWTQYIRYDEALARVTPADVQRVAKQYLNVKQSTTGWYVPESSK
jgi:zinc protease